LSSQILTEQRSTALDVWVRLMRAQAAASRELGVQLVAEHGLTLNDFEALLHLARAEDGRLRRVDLAERLILTQSGVTRLLDGLEEAGCVEKASCASDARVTYAVLTEVGRRKLEAASCDHFGAVEKLFEAHLSKDELAQLSALLGRLPGVGAASAEECQVSP
jgi:DNA-binding MarR family transcriptional regulator